VTEYKDGKYQTTKTYTDAANCEYTVKTCSDSVPADSSNATLNELIQDHDLIGSMLAELTAYCLAARHAGFAFDSDAGSAHLSAEHYSHRVEL
jgi:hypothetical protein